ncbi:hypothetical protein F0M18_08415 [Pseudohalioglobus sediminis]|jgi:hypothetical protein|uniref:Uncharacterized protein n=1 Tax=Pseudohalioglobus sediminis TaxID=2606449 RepID=A0A5B0X032_9GAMM|nr:hypothetical protein [Pseudohalioglobus sediminis]KAA1192673.1 hypothetical protein F0M18_08415 [Pseudohalioglobus sediminis]
MKVYSSDGSVLMEVKSLDHNGSNLEFTGTVMGAMPVKGALSPEEARTVFKLIKGFGFWMFLLTFLFRRSK